MNRILSWLDDNDNFWGVGGVVFGVVCLAAAARGGHWTLGYLPHPLVVIAILAFGFGIAQLLRKRWARWIGLAWHLLLLMFLLIGLLIDWSILAVISPLVWGVFMVLYVRHFFRRVCGEVDNENRPFLSLVLLFRERPYLDADVMSTLASRAWGIEFDATEDDSQAHENGEQAAFIVGEAPLMIGKHPDAFFLVHAFDSPYFDDLEEVADQMPELRIRKAILEHRGWVAVDVLQWLGEGEGTAGAYRMIARLLAELTDENVLAVVDPDADLIVPYDPETEHKLRSDDPCAQLRSLHYVPVIAVEDDDPKMLAAVAEARRRWPEFVTAFENREEIDARNFSVKAPLGTGDDVEYMWAEVASIENDVFYGKLGNEPTGGKLKVGDRVKFPVSQLNDWLYLLNGEIVGGFTVQVVSQRASRDH